MFNCIIYIFYTKPMFTDYCVNFEGILTIHLLLKKYSIVVTPLSLNQDVIGRKSQGNQEKLKMFVHRFLRQIWNDFEHFSCIWGYKTTKPTSNLKVKNKFINTDLIQNTQNKFTYDLNSVPSQIGNI